MKNFKQIALGLLVGAMAIGFSAFTGAKKLTSNFYEYTSSSVQKADIQNINNYVATAADPCSGTTDVCGVTLATAHNVGTTPDPGEFSAEQDNLWASQDDGLAADGNIGMKD
ncbi:MAG: hypothetical protein ACHQHN_08150 [Sphingobacteriales bacterium]